MQRVARSTGDYPLNVFTSSSPAISCSPCEATSLSLFCGAKTTQSQYSLRIASRRIPNARLLSGGGNVGERIGRHGETIPQRRSGERVSAGCFLAAP